MNSLSGTGMALEALAAQCRNVRICLWMEESSTICSFWREKLLTKAEVGTWIEAKKLLTCLKIEADVCFKWKEHTFKYEVSSEKYTLSA